MLKFAKFDDLELESAYVREERASHLPVLRMLGAVGVVFLILFILAIQFYFAQRVQLPVMIFAFLIMIVPGLALTSLPEKHYPEKLHLDLVFLSLLTVSCVGIFVWFAVVDYALRPVDAMVPLALWAAVMIAASVTFVANVRYFVAWAAIYLASFLIVLWFADLDFMTKLFQFFVLGLFFAFALYVNWSLDLRARSTFVAQKEVEAERAKSEELLFNVLPEEVANRLRSGEAVADSFGDVSVVFADVVGFSTLTKQLAPGHLVRVLNDFFMIADQCAEKHGLEKVKTIGDAYLAVAGGTVSAGQRANNAIDFGKDLIAGVRELGEVAGVDLKLRIGIHTGPVIGGVVGSNRLTYDYWGDTMNVASRIEGVAKPNGIAVSAAAFFECGRAHEFGLPEMHLLKGVGEIEVRHAIL